MKIHKLDIQKILDSRGEETIEVFLTGEDGKIFSSQIPSGKSRGAREAAVLPFGRAAEAISFLNEKLAGASFASVRELDEFLLKLDSSPHKENLGGNVMLGVSIAFSRALADQRGEEVWQVLRGEFFKNVTRSIAPRIFSNLINGGAHARNNLGIQEYMVIVPTDGSVTESISALKNFYEDLGKWFKTNRPGAEIEIGDEGGYSMNFENNTEPLKILQKQIVSSHFSGWQIAVDAAASGFFKDGSYRFEGKSMSSQELTDVYRSWAKEVTFFHSIEDPFAENDEKSFRQLKNALPGLLIVGDDLTVTNQNLIYQYGRSGAINGVIVKPNQIGTVSEACGAIQVALQLDIRYIVSHRSGETKDPFIIHLAKASNAYGVKIGAPVFERLSKFNELTRLYSSHN